MTKKIYLEDVDVTLYVDTEADLQPTEDTLSERNRFLSVWANWAIHYDLRFTPSAADFRIAARLTDTYGVDTLISKAKEFWLLSSGPLLAGDYNQHMVLFASFLKGGQ